MRLNKLLGASVLRPGENTRSILRSHWWMVAFHQAVWPCEISLLHYHINRYCHYVCLLAMLNWFSRVYCVTNITILISEVVMYLRGRWYRMSLKVRDGWKWYDYSTYLLNFQTENLNKITDLEFKASLNYTGNSWLSSNKTEQ